MSETDLHSTALQQTLLKSEGLRILVILAFVVFFEVVYAVRIFLLGSLVPRWGLLAFQGFGIYELVILFAVRRALVEQRDLPAARESPPPGGDHCGDLQRSPCFCERKQATR